MFARRTAPLGALCALLAVPAIASQATAGTSSLAAPPPAVQAAIRDLWARSPRVEAADASLRAAQERAHAAGQPVYNPSLQLDGENADVDRRTVGASLTLDVTGKRGARVVENAAAVRGREAVLRRERRDVAAEWLKAWAGTTLARDQVVLGRERLALMQRFDAEAARRLEAGDISGPERDLARLALGEAHVQQSALDAQAASADAALAALGSDVREPLPALPRELPPSIDAVVPVPEAERIETVEAQAEQERSDAAVVVADRARRPDPTVSLTGGQVRSGPRTDRVVGVSVSIPIPLRNSGRHDVDAARADADAAWAARRAVALRVAAQWQGTRATYAALRAASESFRRTRAEGRDAPTLQLDRLWQAGEITTSDYLVQVKQHLDTALAGLALENQAWQAWFDYLATSGRLTEWIGSHAKDTTP
ncbi:TolC family protein [Bacillus sp. NP157]|nr:TolC family protein [Bacillus sp. NP157]